MDNDDEQIGRVLNRREMLRLFGKAGIGMLAGYGALRQSDAFAQTDPVSCVVKPALTVGPYWVDEKLNRSDIRSDPTSGEVKGGTPFDLTFRVSRVTGDSCTPIVGATVDIWHCDALGVYSDFTQEGTAGQKWLRGYQRTDGDGIARFTTIYPGWYPGRAVHIHFKIRTDTTDYARSDFTSQLFFEESITDIVHARQPYAAKGQNRLRNASDMIYRQGGSRLLIAPTQSGDRYAATFDLGVQVACADLANGDITADEAVNIQDATSALRTAVGLDNPSDCALRAGDVNGDGMVKVADALLILRNVVDGTAFP